MAYHSFSNEPYKNDVFTFKQFLREVKKRFKNGEWKSSAERLGNADNVPNKHPALVGLLNQLNDGQMERFLYETLTIEYGGDLGNNGVDVMNSIGYDFGDSASASSRFVPGKLRALIEATLAKVNAPGYMGGPDEYYPTDADELVRLTVDSIVLSYYRNGRFDSDWNYYLSYSPKKATPKKATLKKATS